LNPTTLRKALIYGTVMASFNVEDFSLKRLTKLKTADINNRYNKFLKSIQL
jgi:cytidine kinase